MSASAKQAGVARPTLYNYFPDVEFVFMVEPREGLPRERELAVLGEALPSDGSLTGHITGSVVGAIGCLTAFRGDSTIRVVKDRGFSGCLEFDMGNVG